MPIWPEGPDRKRCRDGLVGHKDKWIAGRPPRLSSSQSMATTAAICDRTLQGWLKVFSCEIGKNRNSSDSNTTRSKLKKRRIDVMARNLLITGRR